MIVPAACATMAALCIRRTTLCGDEQSSIAN
jgi:hypothetical protein